VKEKDLGLKFWAAVAVSAIGMGVAIAFVAGFFLGHFTGHHHTTTVVAGAATTSTESEETASAPSEEGEAVTASNGITLAPEFSPEELAEEAGDNWITNGGGTMNDRFSSLDEINTENVSELKGEWMTKIGQNATSAKFSAEGQALEYEGTIYIPDGADDVFAMDAHTGEIIWTYEPHLPPDPLGEVICCGWDNRGVAIGDGMVFVSQLNGDQVALDQETGKVKWSTPVVKPKSGYSITSAPLYYNGTVYAGGSGGEYGIRGRLTALDAKTGEIKWKSYTIPGPGEAGHNTWPANNDSWKRGGAGIWNTPAVDPKTNTLFFSTSNASPDWNGAERAGNNEWAASIVAMDAETGKIKWGYQQVHHDLWDYDSPSPTLLFDGEMNGEQVEAVGEPSKTGWVYILDRETGKPIYPIPEVKVPQDPAQKTSPTQPEPSVIPPFSPIQTSQESVEKVEEAVATNTPKQKVVGTKIFTPMSTDPTTINLTPTSAVGGDNWQPSSYDPEKDMYIVCSQEGVLGVIAETGHTEYNEGETFEGGEIGGTTGFNAPGFLTAYDMSTGEMAWQKKFPESCYSGAVTTAGGLVFVGQNNGELQAYDVESGEKLWSFQTGAGANTTVTPFEDEGEEKIAIYAGGNSLAATPHGENFWVFSLKGTMGPEEGTEKEGEGTVHKGEEEGKEANEEGETPAEETSPEGEEAEGEPTEEGGETAAAGGAPNAEAGEEVFSENCSTCHGATGMGGNGGPDLTTMPKAKEQAGAEEQVTNGGGGMPAFKGTLSEEEIKNVAAYVVEDIVGGK
jgi:quinohemoprotein ethanol dehydrogenase